MEERDTSMDIEAFYAFLDNNNPFVNLDRDDLEQGVEATDEAIEALGY